LALLKRYIAVLLNVLQWLCRVFQVTNSDAKIRHISQLAKFILFAACILFKYNGMICAWSKFSRASHFWPNTEQVPPENGHSKVNFVDFTLARHSKQVFSALA
jgi:hypothetical protein